MNIQLRARTTVATISTEGGYVTSLADHRGDIFYPKRKHLTPSGVQKARGGCHVCLPNFGPGGASGLAQHGFGRTSEWQVDEQSSAGVTLRLTGVSLYEALDAVLVYQLQAQQFTMRLILHNSGDVPLLVAPAFHPYFAVGAVVPVLDGQTLHDLAPLADTLFVDGARRELVAHDRHITLRSTNLSRWAVWTDQRGPYLCVEPTYHGNVFAEDMAHADQIAPGQRTMYELCIQW